MRLLSEVEKRDHATRTHVVDRWYEVPRGASETIRLATGDEVKVDGPAVLRVRYDAEDRALDAEGYDKDMPVPPSRPRRSGGA